MKGLEPEIQRLIAKHKAEVQKIKVLHEVCEVNLTIHIHHTHGMHHRLNYCKLMKGQAVDLYSKRKSCEVSCPLRRKRLVHMNEN